MPQSPFIQANSDYVSSEFRPLGIRLAVKADRPETLAAVAAACRGWEGEPDGTGPLLRLDIVVGRDICRDGDPEIRVDGRRLRIEGGGVEAEADSAAGSARCAVTEERLADREALCGDVLDPLLLFLLTRNGRAPIHAAGFLAGDLAVLLAGPSGAGKSCLALAAQAAGFRLLGDDILYVQLRPELRVRGVPRAIHVFPDDAPGAAGSPIRVRKGKLKRAVPITACGTAPTARKAVLCLLDRGKRASLEPIGSGEALRGQRWEPGFDLLSADIEAALAALTRNGAWRLALSSDPAEAIGLLSRNLSRLGQTAAP